MTMVVMVVLVLIIMVVVVVVMMMMTTTMIMMMMTTKHLHLSRPAGYPIVGHSGSTFGYRNLLTLVPSQRLGVFTAMTGRDNSQALRGSLHAFLLDHALGIPPWLNESTLCSFPAPWHDVDAPRTSPLYAGGDKRELAHHVSAYVGSYVNPAYGRMEVREWQDTDDGSDDGREPALARLTLFYGFATWDLVLLPFSSSSSSSGSSESSLPDRPEYFFGKGRNITAWVDYSPFVFHPPPKGSDVIVELSVPGLEKRVPPVFTRVGWATSAGNGLALGFYSLLTAAIWSSCVFWLQ